MNYGCFKTCLTACWLANKRVNIFVVIACNWEFVFQEEDTIQVYKQSIPSYIKHDHHTKPDIPDNNPINTEAMASATHSQMSSSSRGSGMSGNVEKQHQKH